MGQDLLDAKYNYSSGMQELGEVAGQRRLCGPLTSKKRVGSGKFSTFSHFWTIWRELLIYD